MTEPVTHKYISYSSQKRNSLSLKASVQSPVMVIDWCTKCHNDISCSFMMNLSQTQRSTSSFSRSVSSSLFEIISTLRSVSQN